MTSGKLKELAFKNKDVAYAIIGQAMLDKGDIGLGCMGFGRRQSSKQWKITNLGLQVAS